MTKGTAVLPLRLDPTDDQQATQSLEVEAIAHLPVDLARIVIVKASEGEAVVQQPARVGNVLCIDGDRPIFTDRLTHRQVRGYVAGQIGASVRRGRVRIAVGKSRTVIDVERGIELIGKIAVHAQVQGIPLVVIQRRIAWLYRTGGRIRRIAN